MEVIDLLNKIANGEEVPKKIKVYDDSFTYIDKWEQYTSDNTDKPLLYIISAFNYSGLNDEVEIIEEDKKIEKLDIYNCFEQLGDSLLAKERLDYNFNAISDKINEIIDKINEEK